MKGWGRLIRSLKRIPRAEETTAAAIELGGDADRLSRMLARFTMGNADEPIMLSKYTLSRPKID